MSLFLYFRSFLLCRWACQRASSASSRKLAPILRCTSAIKRFPSVKREPAFCGPENAGLKMQVLERRERKRRRRNFLVGVGGDPLTALPEIGGPARKAACMFG